LNLPCQLFSPWIGSSCWARKAESSTRASTSTLCELAHVIKRKGCSWPDRYRKPGVWQLSLGSVPVAMDRLKAALKLLQTKCRLADLRHISK
jgi:hypothetical protein